MALPIEDYALIGDCQTAGLVGRDGSVDWLCLPRFDSGACFTALLGTTGNGRWQLAPAVDRPRAVRRRYRGGTLILESDFETPGGSVTVVDFMPPRSEAPDLVRMVVGRRGRVRMRAELVVRFDYGSIVPWVRRLAGGRGVVATAGPDTVYCRSAIPMRGEAQKTVAEFDVAEGERRSFTLTWAPTYAEEPREQDVEAALHETEGWWTAWSSRGAYQGPWKEAVTRSLITLKALTYGPTGGLVAAATTSLPEEPGGMRNWDYRYCWLRDATFALVALDSAGYREEAQAWRKWLVNAAAGNPDGLQIMYGVAGERRLTELELKWLPGYEGSAPVRIGNGAYGQRQLDVYGEVLDAMHEARKRGLPPSDVAWRVQRSLVKYVEHIWDEPDDGIWEVRGPRRHYTHSKVMAWVAMDRAVKAVESFGLGGDAARWRGLRDRIHAEVCDAGFNKDVGSFVQYYGSDVPDASLLMIPLVGFLPATDPRVAGTVDYVRRRLEEDGLVRRYPAGEGDGLKGREGSFLLCTFWLADCLALQGKRQEATEVFERVLSLRNDVGLLSEEYDVRAKRLVGNFPQAFSHVGLINTARNLSEAVGPGAQRRG